MLNHTDLIARQRQRYKKQKGIIIEKLMPRNPTINIECLPRNDT